MHRDISPHDVLVGSDGGARVRDFGVAKAVGRTHVTREGQLKGKLSYMPPEQIQGSVSRRTDLYAMAVVLWESLTGQRLFSGENDASILHKVLVEEVAAPSSIVGTLPSGLDALTLRGLDRDPARRFPDARAMAAAIAACVPLAETSVVGEWVARLAAESLDKRAALVAAIERQIEGGAGKTTEAPRAYAENQPVLPIRDSATVREWRSPPGGRPTGAPGARESLTETKIEGGVTDPDGANPSQISIISSMTKPAPTRARRKKLAYFIALGLTAVSLSVVIAVRVQPDRQPPASTASDEAHRPLPLSVTPSLDPSQPSMEGIHLDPTLTLNTSEKSPEPAPSIKSSASTAPRARPAKVGASSPALSATTTRVAPAPTATAPTAEKTSLPGCDPPYVVDDKGYKRFKPECY
ncbi:MAG: hypothetical protein NVSMB1_06400 [Polyangiales bacterium]